MPPGPVEPVIGRQIRARRARIGDQHSIPRQRRLQGGDDLFRPDWRFRRCREGIDGLELLLFAPGNEGRALQAPDRAAGASVEAGLQRFQAQLRIAPPPDGPPHTPTRPLTFA